MASTAQPVEQHPLDNQLPNRERPLVLVVDDDRTTRAIVRKFLEKGGFDFDSVCSGADALLYIEDCLPDAVFTDIQMPGMSGIELCRAIRRKPALKDLPVILFTGKSDIGTLSEAFEAGASDYLVKPLRDLELISRARHHAMEFRRKTEARQRIAALYKQNESKTRFLGVASHDLRNPLVSIRGISQFLVSKKFGDLNESQQEMVETILEASESMLALVEDLLDVTKIESDHIDLTTEPIAVGELLRRAVSLHQPAAAKKGIELQLLDHSDGAMAHLDRKLINRVIDNLVSNATKFTFPNTRVFLVADAFDGLVRFSIEDEGPGIPEEEFEKLFKEFSRTSNMPTGGESSSGIGLFVVKRIVERHGGQISVENRAQGGARFFATFKRISS